MGELSLHNRENFAGILPLKGSQTVIPLFLSIGASRCTILTAQVAVG